MMMIIITGPRSGAARGGARRGGAGVRGSHLSNTTCLTQGCFKNDKYVCKLW